MAWLMESGITCFSRWRRPRSQSYFLFQATCMNVRWNSFLCTTKNPSTITRFCFPATPSRRLVDRTWLVRHYGFRVEKGWENFEKTNLLLHSNDYHEYTNIGLYSGRPPCAQRSGRKRCIFRSFAILIMTRFFIRFVFFSFYYCYFAVHAHSNASFFSSTFLWCLRVVFLLFFRHTNLQSARRGLISIRSYIVKCRFQTSRTPRPYRSFLCTRVKKKIS